MIFNDHFSVVLYVFDTCILKNHFFFRTENYADEQQASGFKAISKISSQVNSLGERYDIFEEREKRTIIIHTSHRHTKNGILLTTYIIIYLFLFPFLDVCF